MDSVDSVRRKIQTLQQQVDDADYRAEMLQREADEGIQYRERVGWVQNTSSLH